MKNFNHSIYTKLICWYLLLNGLLSILISIQKLYLGLMPENKAVFIMNGILFPCISSFVGYFLIIKELIPLKFLPIYLIFSLLIIGIDSWIYSHSYGLSINFQFEINGIILGLNLLPIICLALYAKHLSENDNNHATN